MDLIREYIKKLIHSGERALNDLDDDDLLRVLGDMDFVEHRAEAVKILVKEEMKERKKLHGK